MAEFYRFRSTDRLLHKSQELERQVVYFADPAQLNDPMEGLRDMVWSGDPIAWTNLFKHYAYCLHWAYFYIRIGGSPALEPEAIPITTAWISAPTPQFSGLFTEIWNAICEELRVSVIVDNLTTLGRQARRTELLFYLHNIHIRAIGIIRRVHAAHNLEPPSNHGSAEDETLLTESAFFELLSEVDGEAELAQRLFLVWNLVKDEQTFHHGVSSTLGARDVASKPSRTLFWRFPQDYVLLLEKILWPSWYAACFSKDCSNSSAWGTYGDGHRGVCLTFVAEEHDDERIIGLKDRLGAQKIMTFRDIEYTDSRDAVEFFRNIGRLPVNDALELWYRDEAGNTSSCASHLPSGSEDSWTEEYWQRFYRDITTKTSHWDHEKESRLILHGLLEDELEKCDRCLTYDFESLSGIIFGIRTPYQDKMRIIDIVRQKCLENGRREFGFFQAFYSPEDGEIKNHELAIEVGEEA